MKGNMKEYFKSDNGQNSMARLMLCVICLWKLAEGTVLMMVTIYQGKIPTLADMPLQWAGVVALLYGLNKFGTKEATAPAIEPTKEVVNAG